MDEERLSTIIAGASQFHQPSLWSPELLPDVQAMSMEDDDETMETTDEERAAKGVAGLARIGFAPIVRVDASRREIELCATSEAVDSHGTIFDYDASKEAFTRWVGNVREMHQRQAVGSRVAVRCDDETRRIYVRIRVSRGAQDTWEKVLDGTLRGASIGASGVVWQRQQRRFAGEPRWLDVATRYDLVELSLVDNPSNPDALGVSFVRDATPDAALLDPLDVQEEQEERVVKDETKDAPAEADGVAEAAEAAEAADAAPATMPLQPNQANRANRANRERLHGAARAVMAGCGCARCRMAETLLAENMATAERMAPDDDQDHQDDQPMARALAVGLDENAAQLGEIGASVRALRDTLDATAQRMAGEVGGLSWRVAALESQPLAGGPAARPVEKSSALAGHGPAGPVTAAEQYRALESLAGRVQDPQAQVALATELIRLQRGMAGG